MLQSFIITFRETLEAALIVGIVLSYLSRIGQTRFNKTVYAAIAAGIVGSLFFAWMFNRLEEGFTGRTEELFEGITMLITVVFITIMIFWFMNNKNIAGEIRERIDRQVGKTYALGLFSLVFLSISREGLETVIFLRAIEVASEGYSLLSAIAGIAVAMLLGFVIFLTANRVNLSLFFNATGILLMLFAAGLTAHGIHELQEAGTFPIIIEHVWDINPPVIVEGVYPVLHEKGLIGGLFKSLFGYNGNPSLIEVIGYFAYLLSVTVIWMRISK